jgi:hypothetical protein
LVPSFPFDSVPFNGVFLSWISNFIYFIQVKMIIFAVFVCFRQVTATVCRCQDCTRAISKEIFWWRPWRATALTPSFTSRSVLTLYTLLSDQKGKKKNRIDKFLLNSSASQALTSEANELLPIFNKATSKNYEVSVQTSDWSVPGQNFFTSNVRHFSTRSSPKT